MSHLTLNNNHWYVASPFTLAVTIQGTPSADLTSLEWIIDGLVSVTAGITTADNTDGDAVVTIPVAAADTSTLAVAVYEWQLQASVQASGPRVIAIGVLRLDALADA